MRVAVVLWDGNVGGAERFTVELAGALRRMGVDPMLVFVRDPKTLAVDLDRLDVPYVSFGARRVEEVLRRPRAFARLVAAHGPDGALLPAVGHQAPALWIGGYRAPVVAMEHGFLLLIESMARHGKLARSLERRFSARFVDAEVEVSEFMRTRAMNAPHARRVEVIENGIDVERFAGGDAPDGTTCVFGFASRLIEGKGIPELLEAFGTVAERASGDVLLRIAGDGPERSRAEALVAQAGLGGRVELMGVVDDMPAFWHATDVGVMPSTAPESFGMVALEAMASGRPVVATRNGGADDLVADGVTGRLVPCGDASALAEAMLAYADDPDLRRAHGAAGRERCEAEFAIDRCAWRYASLLAEIGGRELPPPPPVKEPLEELNV